MKRVSAVVLGVLVVGLSAVAAPALQDDNGKKIVGKWEVTKSGSDLPNGSVIEFTKDGKLNLLIKLGDKDEKAAGTYKVEKDQLVVKITFNDQTIEETATIKKLTDDDLEIEDKDKKVDVFKKKK